LIVSRVAFIATRLMMPAVRLTLLRDRQPRLGEVSCAEVSYVRRVVGECVDGT
jgi:hypothetical protein